MLPDDTTRQGTLPRRGPRSASGVMFEALEPRLMLDAAPVVDDPIGPVIVAEDAPQTEIDLLDHLSDPDVTDSIFEFQTVLGSFNVQMYDAAAPITVANFAAYAHGGDYDDSFIHRSVTTASAGVDVIQGGGYWIDNMSIEEVASRGTILNEPGISNLRGTIAMARIGGQVNSATSEWYFNLLDNTALDGIDEGFTVFGEVMGDGMDVVDVIAALTIWDASSVHPVLTDVPLIDYVDGPLQVNHLVMLPTIQRLSPLTFEVTANSNPGLVTATIHPDGYLALDYAPEAHGEATITLLATDADEDTVETTFTVTVNDVPDPPTLTTVDPLAGASRNLAFTVTWQMLADAADEADAEDDPLSFRVEAVSAGTLKKGGTAVTPGVTLVAAGESLAWTPPLDDTGMTDAFTVVAWDGTAASDTPVQVQVDVDPSYAALVTLGWDAGTQQMEVVYSDPATGACDNVGAVGDLAVWHGETALSADGRLLFVEGYGAGGTYQLYTVNLENGACTQQALSLPAGLLPELTFAGVSEGDVIALGWNTDDGLEHVLEIDPATGTVVSLGTVADMKWWFRQTALNGTDGEVYVAGRPHGGTFKLYTFDLTTGTVTAQPEFADSETVFAGLDSAGNIVGLRWNGTEGVEEVYRIDPATAAAGARVGTLDDIEWWRGDCVVDADTDEVFVAGTTAASEDRLYKFELDTGTASDQGQTPAQSGEFVNHVSWIEPPVRLHIIDDGDDGFDSTGAWTYKDGLAAYQGDHFYAAAGDGSATARWTFTGLVPGVTYRISVTWLEAINRATDAPFRVLDGAAEVGAVDIDQQSAPDDFTDAGAAWEDLGTFILTGDTLVVELANDAASFVMADAVRLERL